MSGDVYFNQNRQDESSVSQYSPKIAESYLERIDTSVETEEKDVFLPEETSEKPKNSNKGKNNKKKDKKRTAIKVLCIILGIILLLSLIGGITLGVILKDYESETLEDNAYVDESDLMHSAGVYNILLMGIDAENVESTSRSDSMILMSINTRKMQIKLTSFMRDTYVDIPGYYGAKLNAACTYGGPQLVIDTIEYNFGIRIDAYCKIGYEMLVTLVDGIGGITVPEITDIESAAMAIEGADVAPGTDVHLDGNEALQYCRIRKGQSDFNRTERQRETISIIVKKCLSTNPFKLIKIMKEIVGEVQCSVSKAGMIRLAFKVLPCLLRDLESGRVPADGTWSNAYRNGQAVLLVDFDANKEYLEEFIYG